MKYLATGCFVLFFLFTVCCSQSDQPDENKAPGITSETSEVPLPPSIEYASSIIVEFVENSGVFSEFKQFMKIHPDLVGFSPTVIVQLLEIGDYNNEERHYFVKAYLLLATKKSNGEIKELDNGIASSADYPTIPGNWDFSFSPSRNGKWKVEVAR